MVWNYSGWRSHRRCHTANNKIRFWSNITTTSPVVTDWGNIGNMSYPHELYIFKKTVIGMVLLQTMVIIQLQGLILARIFLTHQQATNLGSFGILNGPTGISPIKDNKIGICL